MAWVFEGKEVLVCEKKKLTRDEIKELERRGARTMVFEDINEVSEHSGCHGPSYKSKTISTGCGSSSHYSRGCSSSSCGG